MKTLGCIDESFCIKRWIFQQLIRRVLYFRVETRLEIQEVCFIMGFLKYTVGMRFTKKHGLE